MIGLLWSLQETDSLLLLEEPELSLHTAIVEKLPSLISKIGQKTKKYRQVIISTHSWELLDNRSIGGNEVLMIDPNGEGSKIEIASSRKNIKTLLESGMTVADAVLPLTKPSSVTQLSLI